MNVYYILDMVICTGNKVVNEKGQVPTFIYFIFYLGKDQG